jgi:hypothetical protein
LARWLMRSQASSAILNGRYRVRAAPSWTGGPELHGGRSQTARWSPASSSAVNRPNVAREDSRDQGVGFS